MPVVKGMNPDWKSQGLIARRRWPMDNQHINDMIAVVEAAHGLRDKLKDKPDTPDCPDKTSESHLTWMLTEICSASVTGSKAQRWLGFVQGIMVSRGYITVDGERDRTRPIFTGVS